MRYDRKLVILLLAPQQTQVSCFYTKFHAIIHHKRLEDFASTPSRAIDQNLAD